MALVHLGQLGDDRKPSQANSNGLTMSWSEADSKTFIDEGAYYVPERELQIRTICDLIPPAEGPMLLVELCSGEGLLTRALLERFPEARMLAFDGSETMLASTRERAGTLAARLTTRQFELEATDWRPLPEPCHAVVSSLAVHHLNGEEKQQLFRDLFASLAPGGVFVLADLIAPTREEGVAVAAAAWDETVREQAIVLDGDLAAFERFLDDEWNMYSFPPEPGSRDQPSSVVEQLEWLKAAGFTAVDLHWMKAGHVIMSGVKPQA
jgi:tRNA (cmo5U34)-methyltransferase